MHRIFVCAATLLLAGANGPRAEETLGSPTNPHQLPDTIVVSANRVPTSVDKVANSVTIITRKQIEQSQATFVAHLLRSVPAVDVVESGGPGKSSSVFLRGTGSQHVLVIRDGVKMNDPSSPNGSFDFGNLSTDGIERIEILRGSQSVLYGSDAIGGVIEIFTRRGAGRPSISFTGETGSFNSYHESATISAGNNSADLSFTLAHQSSDGFSASETTTGSSENDSYRHTSASGTIGLSLPSAIELKLSGSLSDGETDIDQTSGVLDDPNFTNATDSRTLSATLSRQISGAIWTPQLNVSQLRHEYNSEDQVDRQHPADMSEISSRATRLMISTQHNFKLLQHLLILGGEWEREEYQSELDSRSSWGAYSDMVDPTDIRTTSAYLSDNWSVSENGMITSGVRLDHHEEFGDHLTYRIAGAFKVPDAGTKAKIAFSTGFKAPTLYQLYHPMWGNQELSPEKSINREIGFEQSILNNVSKIAFTYFQIQLTDLFSYDPTTYRPVNIGKASSEGVEVSADYSAGPIGLKFAYTFTDTKDESTDAPVLRRPRHKIASAVTYRIGKRLHSGLNFRYTGSRDDVDFATFPSQPVTLKSYMLTDISMSYSILPQVELRARVHNLFDKSYQEVYSYGTSRRALYAGVTAKL